MLSILSCSKCPGHQRFRCSNTVISSTQAHGFSVLCACILNLNLCSLRAVIDLVSLMTEPSADSVVACYKQLSFCWNGIRFLVLQAKPSAIVVGWSKRQGNKPIIRQCKCTACNLCKARKSMSEHAITFGFAENRSRSRHNVEWVFVGVLYFGWPNQPSSGTMRILHWNVIFMLHMWWYRK